MIYAVLSLRECKRVGALSSTLYDTCARRHAHANGSLKGQFCLFVSCQGFVAFCYNIVILKESWTTLSEFTDQSKSHFNTVFIHACEVQTDSNVG